MSNKKDEALLRALGVLVEVTNYTGSETWSPSMTRDCERAIKYIKEALNEQPSTVPDNSQEWRGMDGATAYWLIQRHADGWADIGKMMGEWLAANQAQPAQQEPVAWRERIKELADQYARECVEFAKAIPSGFDSMSPIALKAGDARFSLHTAIDAITASYTSPPASKPLTDERRKEIINKSWNDYLRGKEDGTWFSWHLSFDIEAAHGIKGDAT